MQLELALEDLQKEALEEMEDFQKEELELVVVALVVHRVQEIQLEDQVILAE